MKTPHLYAIASTSILTISALPQAAFGQIADSWSIAGDTTVEASNTGASITWAPESGAVISGAVIADGSRNTISASAVGASASVTHNTATYQDLAIDDSVGGNITATATNLDSPVSVIGTVDGAVIDLGHDNSISLNAVGASAQFGVTDDVLGGVTVSHSLTVSGDVTLRAENNSAVTIQTDVGANGGGPQINGGTRNAFSGSAIGASAGVSVFAIVDDGTYSSQISIAEGSQINVTAINSGDVTIGSTDDPTQPATLTGATLGADSVDGSISMMAIGASGSVSSTAVVYAGSAEPSVAFGDVTFDVENSGSISSNVSITDLTLEGKNSISVGAVGTSVSNSARYISYTGDGISVSGTLGTITYGSSNSGAVFVGGGIGNASIGSGLGLVIAATAIGASAAFTLP